MHEWSPTLSNNRLDQKPLSFFHKSKFEKCINLALLPAMTKTLMRLITT